MSSGRRVWAISAALAVGAFAVGAVTMLGATYDRPAYGPIADFADEHDAAVIVDGLAFPPGPLTNLNVDETRPRAPVLRLSVPAQLDRPFGIWIPSRRRRSSSSERPRWPTAARSS